VPGQPHHILHYYYVQAGTNFERCVSHPHNLFLDFWLSTGVLGLIAGLWLIAVFVILCVRAWREASPEWKGPLTAVLLIMLATVIHGEVDNSYFLPDLAVIFWLCLGVVTLWERSPGG
jgi:putative inorganic carbon (hco3(-)) transporter